MQLFSADSAGYDLAFASPIRRDCWMLDRTDLEPLFFAPFVSSIMRVEPQWIDYNGHLNMAYYNVLFDRCFSWASLMRPSCGARGRSRGIQTIR